MAAEAIHHSGQEFADSLREALDSEDDPANAIIACTRLLAGQLRDADWIDTCSFSTTAQEAVGSTPQLEYAIEQALEQWQDLVADKLRRAGIDEDDARDLACTVINTLEGAELACQISRSDRPLQLAGTHLARLITTSR